MGTKNYRHNAFTLVELLIVISILAILAALIVIFLKNQTFKGNDSRRKSDLNRIKIAIEEYEKDHNCYPSDPGIINCKPGTGLRPYLDVVPCDPNTNGSYVYEFENTSCPGWYRLYTDLQNTKDLSITPNIGPGNAYNFWVGSPNAVDPSQSTSGNSNSGFVSGATTGYWGCVNHACVPINLKGPGQPVCNPSYVQSSCNGDCALPGTVHECKSI